jgi:hypothetical protein
MYICSISYDMIVHSVSMLKLWGKIILLILILSGCKDKQHVDYYPVPDALKKACLFQKGSYWVYRNDSTGLIDCTYVKSNPVSGSISESSHRVVDYIETYLESRLYTEFYLRGEFPYDSSPVGYPLLTYLKGYGWCCRRPVFVLYEDTLYNHHGGESCNCGSDKMPFYDASSFSQLGAEYNFKINDIVFDRVELTRTTFVLYPDFPSDIDTVDFYYSSGNGIVKMVLRMDTVPHVTPYHPKRATMSWSLLRYKAVQ